MKQSKRIAQLKKDLDGLYEIRDKNITERTIVDILDDDIIDLQIEYRSIVGDFYHPKKPHLYLD